MKKRKLTMAVLVLTAIIALTACTEKSEHGLSKKDPVTITVWNYYNGAQKEKFDNMVRQFNETMGKEKGIVVQASSKGAINELVQAVSDSIQNKVGSEKLPDVFAAYADIAYQIDQSGLAADISQYLTDEEIGEYVDAYMEEGRFDSGGSIKLFPIAKSTEVFGINKTDWDKFASATGASDAAFSTWEGITKTAEEYYNWTDSQTPEPGDGKAFFGRDAFANYMIIGSLQLGHEIYQVMDGEVVLDLDKDTMKKLWDNYYIPYIKGHFAAHGKFRSDDVKTGELLALVGSTSGFSYFPTTVTLEDGTSYNIEHKIYTLPNFEGTEPCAVQQGAGMMIVKSTEAKEFAAATFLKWFTDESTNVEFAIASGYLPVKKAGSNREAVEAQLKSGSTAQSSIGAGLAMGLNVVNNYRLYTTKPFTNGDIAREILNTSMDNRARDDRKTVVELTDGGMSLEEALAPFLSEKNFEAWFEDMRKQLIAIGE